MDKTGNEEWLESNRFAKDKFNECWTRETQCDDTRIVVTMREDEGNSWKCSIKLSMMNGALEIQSNANESHGDALCAYSCAFKRLYKDYPSIQRFGDIIDRENVSKEDMAWLAEHGFCRGARYNQWLEYMDGGSVELYRNLVGNIMTDRNSSYWSCIIKFGVNDDMIVLTSVMHSAQEAYEAAMKKAATKDFTSIIREKANGFAMCMGKQEE